MESLAFASLGKFDNAITSQKKLENIYSADQLSDGIIAEYASDRAAQNYGYSVMWLEHLGRHIESDIQMNYVLKEIMPKMPPNNVHNSLIIICPILWVLMDKQKAREAENLFVTYVYDRFYEAYGKDSVTYYISMYKPLRTLFLLAGEDEDRRKGIKSSSNVTDQSITNWVLSKDFGFIKKYISTTMRPYGKDPHCILAEICHLVLFRVHERTIKNKILQTGFELAERSILNTKDDPGLRYAYLGGKKILRKIQDIMSQ